MAENLPWSWKRFVPGALVATIAPQLVGISVVMMFVVGSAVYQSWGMSLPWRDLFGGMGIGRVVGIAAGIAILTLPSTLIYAGIIARVFCVKPWTRRPWKAVGFGAILTTAIYLLSAGALVGFMVWSEPGFSLWNNMAAILLVAAIVWLFALVPGTLTAWIMHRFFKILDRQQLLAEDSKPETM